MFRIILGLMIVMLFSGCIGTTGKRINRLEDKVSSLEQKVDSLKERQDSLDTIQIMPSAQADNSSLTQSQITIDTMTKEDIQLALKKAGFYKGAIDGKIGKETRKAIKKFQEAKGLVPDGVVGPKTKLALLKYLTK